MRLLHERGLLRRCYTQNIDSLEREAGLPANKIVAAHGNFDSTSGSPASDSGLVMMSINEHLKQAAHPDDWIDAISLPAPREWYVRGCRVRRNCVKFIRHLTDGLSGQPVL